ncbi:MAG: hypothetical protein NEHIOOID_00676 [Holosporales bacterium]
MKNKIKITASLMLALPLLAGQNAPVGVVQQVLPAAQAVAGVSTPGNPPVGAVASALAGNAAASAIPAANANGAVVALPATNASTPVPVTGAPAVQTAAGATIVTNNTTVPSTSAPAANTTADQSVDKKFLVSVDVVQKALDDATAFVPIIRIDGKDRAVCFAGAKGAENVGYFMPGEALSDPATTCVSMVPSTKSPQSVVDLSVISGLVSTTPIQWGALAETKPDQIWFVRQQVGVCSTRGADGKVSGIGSFDLADPSKSCYLNDRVASLNDPDIVVMLK